MIDVQVDRLGRLPRLGPRRERRGVAVTSAFPGHAGRRGRSSTWRSVARISGFLVTEPCLRRSTASPVHRAETLRSLEGNRRGHSFPHLAHLGADDRPAMLCRDRHRRACRRDVAGRSQPRRDRRTWAGLRCRDRGRPHGGQTPHLAGLVGETTFGAITVLSLRSGGERRDVTNTAPRRRSGAAGRRNSRSD